MGAHHTERGADMSFKTNTYQQLTLNDSYAFLSDRCKKIIDHSWAKSFADIVFPAIDENKFAVLYSDQKFSRPNTPVNVVIGALMLKEQMQLSDEELTESIWCDIRFSVCTSYNRAERTAGQRPYIQPIQRACTPL